MPGANGSVIAPIVPPWYISNTNMNRVMRVILLCLWLVAATLNGCASTLLYNHADWLLTRQIDQYFDLTRSQHSFVSTRLSTLLEHHRQDALPQYEETIRQAAARIQRGLNEDDVEWAFRQYDHLRVDLFARFVLDGTDFLHLVRDAQLPHLKRKLRERLADQEALLREPVETRLITRKERLLALVREWLGPISRAQEQQIADLAMNFPDMLPIVYAHQQRRNDQLMELMERRTQQDSTERLRIWLVDQEMDHPYVEATRHLRHHLKGLFLALDRIATPAQRHHLLAKLDGLARTVHTLRAT
jgi:Family of unknown function (DUF6279)